MLVLVVNCGSSSIKYQVREVTPEGSEPSAYTSSMPAINENVPLATATAGMAGGAGIARGVGGGAASAVASVQSASQQWDAAAAAGGGAA